MKNFFKNIFLLIIAICIAWVVYPQYSQGKTLRFVQLTDLHNSHRSAISGNRMHPNSVELTKAVITQVNELPLLDFVAITGDGVDMPKAELINEFSENIMTFTINYWSDEECSEHFNLFLEELETYRLFIKDYFFSIEDELCFHINSDYPTLRLADDIIYNYLNYNTNL